MCSIIHDLTITEKNNYHFRGAGSNGGRGRAEVGLVNEDFDVVIFSMFQNVLHIFKLFPRKISTL